MAPVAIGGFRFRKRIIPRKFIVPSSEQMLLIVQVYSVYLLKPAQSATVHTSSMNSVTSTSTAKRIAVQTTLCKHSKSSSNLALFTVALLLHNV